MGAILAYLPKLVAANRLSAAVDLYGLRRHELQLMLENNGEEFLRKAQSSDWKLYVLDPLLFDRVDGNKDWGDFSFRAPLVVYGNFAEYGVQCLLDIIAEHSVLAVHTLDADDDPRAISSTLRKAFSGIDVQAVFAELLGRFSGHARTYLEVTLEMSSRPMTVAELASSLFCSPRTLRRRFAQAGLASPGTVISVCRILRAGALIRRERRTVSSASRVLGFGSPDNLSHHFQRHAGVVPSDLRRRADLGLLIASVVPALER